MDISDFFQKGDLKNLKFERRNDNELKKVSEGVFDKQSLITLSRLARKEDITEFRSVIKRGKEANIFYGKKGRREIAVKIYSVEALDFRTMSKYIVGDPRFSDTKNRRQLIYQWAQKEFKNLSRIQDVVECPEPIAVLNNILVMEFIGKKGVPAPEIKDVQLDRPQEYFDMILKYVKAMYARNLVHADLSEYNILDYNGPVLIDFSTGVLLEHPLALEFLERDLRNVLKFFEHKYGLKKEFNKVLEYVKSGN